MRKSASTGDGTTLFGSVVFADDWSDSYTPNGIYKFTATDPTELLQSADIPEFKYTNGVYADGKWYAYEYSYNPWYMEIYSVRCMIYDTATWELQSSNSLENEWSQIPFSSALTYDHSSGKIYGVMLDGWGDSYRLCEISKETGAATGVAALTRPFFALAADNNGALYGIDADGVLVSIDKATGAETNIGSTGLKPSNTQSATCDPETGKLYWAYMSESYAGLYEINKDTGSSYLISAMPHQEEIVGLTVAASERAGGVPAAVTGLKFEPARPGATTGVISCTAPTTDNSGKSLTSDITVKIMVGGTVVKQSTVAPGTTVEVSDYAFASDQLYAISAYAQNSTGEGPRQSITVFVGTDTASSPRNVQLTVDGREATLIWEAPLGKNDGYIDQAAVSYKIHRMAGDKQTEVTTTPAGVTTFSETLPEETAKYSYIVTSISDGEEGGSAQSNAVLSIGHYELPFYDDFQDGDQTRQLYTFVDVDNDGHDNQQLWFWKEDEKLIQFCSDNQADGNDWLISPAIHLDGKNLYTLRFNINMGGYSNLRATIGTSTDPADHTEVILDLNQIWDSWKTQYSAEFAVPSDGTYYIGLYCYNGTNSFYLNLFDLALEKGKSVNAPAEVSDCTVTPAANGAKEASVSCVAPTKTVAGKAITTPVTVTVTRNGTQIKNENVAAGATLTFTDALSSSGPYTYEFQASIGDDASDIVTCETWIGIDTPNNVQNVKVQGVDDNLHALITWDASVGGSHGGYVDQSTVRYTVARSKERTKGYTTIAEGLTETTFTDTEIETVLNGGQELLYYAVAASNESGYNDAVAAMAIIGTPYKAPVDESFADKQLHVEPWLQQTIDGDFGWETVGDGDNGITSQDCDNGMLKYSSIWGMPSDSRLKTPIVNISDCDKPVFSFYMLHWNEDDIAADNKQTNLTIEVAVDGGDFEAVGEPITAAWPTDGWIEHRLPLDAYKNAKQVQFALRGYVDNGWMYYYVDNIHIENMTDNDLAISSFNGPTSAKLNEECTYTVEYYNRGTVAASGYSINLYENGVPVQSIDGEELAAGASATATFKVDMNAAKVGNTTSLYAEVAWAADGTPANNTSRTIDVTVAGTWYPTVENLTGSRDENSAILSWDAPYIPSEPEVTVDGAEDYFAFSIEGFGDWISYDNDHCYSGGPGDLQFINKGQNQAFMVWNPGRVENALEKYPRLAAYAGEQCFVSWYANTSIDGAYPHNDDYLISPEVLGGSEVSFQIRRVTEEYDAETYEIMYSSTTTDIDAFTVLKSLSAPDDWEEVSVTLPEDAKFFAIHYTGELQEGILIDDIAYTSAISSLKIAGYNIFRDGVKLNDTPWNETSYTDSKPAGDSNTYAVSVVYENAESNAVSIELALSGVEPATDTTEVYVGSVPGSIIVKCTDAQPVGIYDIDGRAIYATEVNGTATFSATRGIYIVRVADRTFKVAVR